MDTVLSMWESPMQSPSAPRRSWQHKVTTSRFGDAPVHAEYDQPIASALPGIAITSEVAAAEDKRRTIQGMFVRFAAEREISKATHQAATALLSSLPLEAALPKVAVDDGGVLLAWAVEGKGRTLITVVDSVLHAVANAGTGDAEYFADIPFDGTLPTEVLSVIPR